MPLTPETLGTWVSALLTLMVLSYLLGDNPLYRLAEHLFVGTATGYLALVAYYSVLQPRLVTPLTSAPLTNWTLFVPLFLGVLLVIRLRPAWSVVGVVPLSFLLGVGVALAVGGALFGTVFPQTESSMLSLNPSSGGSLGLVSRIVLVIGSIAALFYFYFSATKGRFSRPLFAAVQGVRGLGRWFIMAAFGAIFATTFLSRVTLLISRVQFLVVDWLHLAR